MTNFIWTPAQKKKASKTLLDDVNNYEVKARKFLRNITFSKDGSARYIGQAHNYTYWAV